MSSGGSVTHWIQLLQAGKDDAARAIWERYFRRLVSLARAKMGGAPRRVADEEDVALSALASFYRGLEGGRFPNLEDRNNLWKLLVVLTARKAVRLRDYERRKKRGGGKVLAVTDVPRGDAERDLLDEAVGHEPSPAFAAQVAEECNRLLNLLDNDTLRSIARWKVEGHTNAEIADKLGCVPHTVERKLGIIRDRWENAPCRDTELPI